MVIGLALILGNIDHNTAARLLSLVQGFGLLLLCRSERTTSLLPETLTQPSRDLLEELPRDIRTIRKRWDNLYGTEVKTITYAACPVCSKTYIWNKDTPGRCNSQIFSKPPCGARLSKLATERSNGRAPKTTKVPKRPFVVPDFDNFRARMYSMPEVEKMIAQSNQLSNYPGTSKLTDILQGNLIRELEGPDGLRFIDGCKRFELRSVWAMSIDWYNPFWNKAAGRKASVGSLVCVNLMLPAHIRFRPEYMYFCTIPGPMEPTLDAVNYFLEPIVDMFQSAWKKGIYLSKTYEFPEGRPERSMLGLGIFDLPAGRKVTGQASYRHRTRFCSFCKLDTEHIHDLDVENWTQHSREELREQAQKWRDATSEKEREEIFQRSGVRWSALWKLDYWNPLHMTVVDTMHALFLGLAKFHYDYVLGINETLSKNGPKTAQPVMPTEVETAMKALNAASMSGLKRCRVDVLRHVLASRSAEGIPSDSMKKNHLIEQLLVSE